MKTTESVEVTGTGEEAMGNSHGRQWAVIRF